MASVAPPPARAGLKDLRKIFGIDGPALRMLRTELSTVHIAVQISRFCRLFAMYFLAHLVFPSGWNWQAVAMLAATSAEIALQQMVLRQLPMGSVLRVIMNSPALCRYLASLHITGVSGAPSTVPIVAAEPAVPDSSAVYTHTTPIAPATAQASAGDPEPPLS